MHHYIGLMSGTSVDGIDAVVVSIGPNDKFSIVATHNEPLSDSITQRIHALCAPDVGEIDILGALDMELGELFAHAAAAVQKKAELPATAIRAIGSHGQTVRHRPTGLRPFTIQIGNPSVIADKTGITTVADFRARDMAAGGQGAPLVPAFHHAFFHSATVNRAIVNIGGISNVTYLPSKGTVIGFDTGPGNTLLDQWTLRHLKKKYDENGAWAAQGKVVEELLRILLADEYFAMRAPKSTGRERFNIAWLENALAQTAAIAPQDVQATLVELTARTIAHAVTTLKPMPNEIYVCGGGSHNAALMEKLRQNIRGAATQTTQALGLDADWVEACAFAWLAHRTLEGLPGNLPEVTGASRPVILGGVYPGNKRPD